MTAYYPKPDIFSRGLQTRGHHLIEASAGTGKTFTIEHLVIALLIEGVALGEILLVTFTEKATAELKQRIRQKLEQLVALPFGSGADLDPSSRWTIGASEREHLLKALFEFEAAPVFTIHGFCLRILREFAFENRRLMDLEHANSVDLFDEIFPQFMRESMLTGEGDLQTVFAAYMHEKPDALDDDRENAYQGSLFKDIRDLLAKPGLLLPDPQEARARWLEFRGFMREQPRVLQVLGEVSIHAGTLRSWLDFAGNCRDLCVAEDLHWAIALASLSFPKTTVSICEPDQWKFTKTGKGKIKSSLEIPETLSRFLQQVDSVRPYLLDLKVYLLVLLVPQLRLRMQGEKRKTGRFDFDDMIAWVAETVAAPHGDSLLRVLRDRYRYAVIDEFQDTDDHQWAIFSKLFLETAGHHLYLVGDPKQAIYGFRGADVNTYLRAGRELDAAGGQRVALTYNYRSSPEMIEGVNRVFGHSSLFQGAISYTGEVRCGQPDRRPRGRFDAALHGLLLEPLAGEQPLEKSEFTAIFGQWIADHIEILTQDSPWLIPEGAAGERLPRPRDICILTRTGWEARAIGEILAQRDIPFAYYRQSGLFGTLEAGFLFDLLYAIEHHDNTAAGFRALYSPFFNTTAESRNGQPVLPAKVREWLVYWRKLAYRYRDYRGLFSRIFQTTKIFERLLFTDDDERAVTNYEQLADYLQREGANLEFRQLVHLLKSRIDGGAAIDEDLLRLETEREAVQIMTIHAAKGLEFPVVFLFGGWTEKTAASGLYHACHDTRLGRVIDLTKSHATQTESETREEVERLYYVAFTRAKFKLFFPLVDRETVKTRSGPGAYGVMLESLASLMEDAKAPVIFETRRPDHPSAARPASSPAGSETSRWQPVLPAETLDYRGVLAQRNPLRISSYTKLVHRGAAKSGLAAEALEPDRYDELPESRVEPESALPKGRNTGICLHEILEQVENLSPDLLKRGTFEIWTNHPEVRQRLTHHLKGHDLEAYFSEMARVVWRALTIPLIEGVAVGWLSERDRLHEVDFHFPIHTVSSGEVFLNGSLDLAFRHGGRYFFADWKSDTLPDYRPATLAEKVRRDYQIQMEIYLSGFLRWLGIKSPTEYDLRFGGIFYLFPRGMDGNGNGIYHTRPDWEEADRFRQHIESYTY